MTDMHSHSAFSHDSTCDTEFLIKTAIDKGIEFLGISEHLDYDAVFMKNFTASLDGGKYFDTAFNLKEKYLNKINVIVGIECGYYKGLDKKYKDFIEKYKPEFVINSVHSANYLDYYVGGYGEKQDTYLKYIQAVNDSIQCGYHFDIVGHIGYASRYAPYDDKRLHTSEFFAAIDDMLKLIIEKDKILEINSSSSLEHTAYLPELSVIERYYELGGRKVSYGSDTHTSKRLLDKRDLIVGHLKEIGFEYLTIPIKNKHIKYSI